MLKFSSEAKVGLLVTGAIFVLAYMSIRLGAFAFGDQDTYSLKVKVENASGLDIDGPVSIAGVEVGSLTNVELSDDGKALLIIRIKKGVKITRNYVAVIKTRGLLGEKYLEILPVSQDGEILKEGDEIINVKTYAEMDKLLDILNDVAVDVKNISSSLSAALGGEEGEQRITAIVQNIEDFTKTLKNDTPAITEELKKVSKSLREILYDNKGNINDSLANLKSATENLDSIMIKLSKATPDIEQASKNIRSITKKIDDGEGTIGKLINDPTTAEKLEKTIDGINSFLNKSEQVRTSIGYRAEHLTKHSETKHYISLKIQPKADKYYLLELVDNPIASIDEKTYYVSTGGGPVTETTIQKTNSAMKFTALIAKRFYNLVIRGGLIENSGGAGLDLYLWNDAIRFEFDAFDFSRDEGTHLKAGVRLNFLEYFYLTGGVDDFIFDSDVPDAEDMKSTYVGLGFEFDDEDVKYLFSNVPVSGM